MGTSKHLQQLLKSVDIDSKTADESLKQRAVSNMNNYIRLINYRLQIPPPVPEKSRAEEIDQLLEFIHRHVAENTYRGIYLDT